MSAERRTGTRHAFRVASRLVLSMCLGLSAPLASAVAQQQQGQQQLTPEERMKLLEERLRQQREAAGQQGQAPARPQPQAQPQRQAAPAQTQNLTPAQRLQLLEQRLQQHQQKLLQQEKVLFEQDRQIRQQFQAIQSQADVIRQQQSVIDAQRDELLTVRTQLNLGRSQAQPQQRAGTAIPSTPLPESQTRSPQQAQTEAQARRMAELKRAEEIARQLAQQRQQQQQQGQAAGQPQAQQPQAQAQARGATDSNPELAASAPAEGSATRPTQDLPDVEAVPDAASVLSPVGQVGLELALNYTFSNVNRVEVAGFTVLPAIAIGSFDITEVDRQSFVGSIALNYGLARRIEVEARIPFIQRTDDTIGRPVLTESSTDVFNSLSGAGIGDVEASIRTQLNQPSAGWPFLLSSLRVKAPTGKDPFEIEVNPATGQAERLPTGSGFWSVTPGITAILPTDPGVIFSSLSYTYNIARDVGDGVGTIKPGDTLSASVGLGLSLNPKISLSIGTSYAITYRTRQNGVPVDGSTRLYSGSMSFSYSYRFNEKRSVTFSFNPGFTSDAPDLSMGLRVPIRF